MSEQKLPLPLLTAETAKQKTQLVEDVWNNKNSVKISIAYTVDSEWRNPSQFINGREEIQGFLADKWETELDYKLKKTYWAHGDNCNAFIFEYEYHRANGLAHIE